MLLIGRFAQLSDAAGSRETLLLGGQTTADWGSRSVGYPSGWGVRLNEEREEERDEMPCQRGPSLSLSLWPQR
jgi:hypothetical protein